MFGNAINDLFTRGLDWQTGSVLALFLLLVVAGLMLIFGRFVQVKRVTA
jgi:ABC-type spermidine/putrescine transport system permease subunit I